MATIQHFRTALAGFNRQDVVSYIEFMTNQYNSQIQQLNTQLAVAQSRPGNSDLQDKLAAAEARIAELEAQLAEGGNNNCTEQELEAYRRAERAERMAKERSRQICDQANGVLAEAGYQVQSAAAAIDTAAQSLSIQLEVYQQAVTEAKQTLQDAARAMQAITPAEE